MDYFKLVNDYYSKNYYTKDQVKVFVQREKITEAQYEVITGEVFTA
jgi:uncharacterized XkdX family phage protein